LCLIRFYLEGICKTYFPDRLDRHFIHSRRTGGLVHLRSGAEQQNRGIRKLPEDARAVRPASQRQAAVQVGISIEKISDFSIKNVAWNADFYVWFRW
jgi:hypothetical protein